MTNFARIVLWPAAVGLLAALALILFFPHLIGWQNIQPVTTEVDVRENKQPSFNGLGSGPVSYSQAVKLAAPAVVNIFTTKTVEQKIHPIFEDPFFRQFFGKNVPRRQRMQSSLGSGVIIGEQGYVLTNNHVIADADEIIVAVQDGKESFAKVVGSDPETDLAVLKINRMDLPTITLDSNDTTAEVGDVVLAIGNPFGVGQTVTMGIISATGRNELGLTTFEDFIQTDAAINPGNSGGALIDARGNLVGINTAIFSKSGGSQGIGFAIPVALARTIMNDIITHGEVIRGWLGVEVQPLTIEQAAALGVTNLDAILITGIYKDGPAHLAGLEPGDVILEIDGVEVQSARTAMTQITASVPGQIIKIGALQKGTLAQLDTTITKRSNLPQQLLRSTSD